MDSNILASDQVVALNLMKRFDPEELRAELEGLSATQRAGVRIRRFREYRVIGDMAWFAQASEVYHLATELVMRNGEEPIELWRTCVDAGYTWEQFVTDFLELPAPEASQMKNVIATYIVALGWSMHDLLTVGRANLKQALGRTRKELSSGKPDEKLINLLRHGIPEAEVADQEELSPATFREVQDYLISSREDGDCKRAQLSVEIQQEPHIEDGEEFTVFDLTLWNDALPHTVGNVWISNECRIPSGALAELMDRVLAKLDGLSIDGWNERERCVHCGKVLLGDHYHVSPFLSSPTTKVFECWAIGSAVCAEGIVWYKRFTLKTLAGPVLRNDMEETVAKQRSELSKG